MLDHLDGWDEILPLKNLPTTIVFMQASAWRHMKLFMARSVGLLCVGIKMEKQC